MVKTPRLSDLEDKTAEAPPLGIPPDADVTVKFRHTVDPNTLAATPGARARAYDDEDLREIAGEDFPEVASDPLTDFCSTWANFSGYTLRITRLPDPAQRRIRGQQYNRSCLEIESLGDTPFDPIDLQGTLQLVNGNSGGVFRLWLIDENGRPIPDAYLPRLAIADPPKDPREQDRRFNPTQPAPVAAPAPPTEFELMMQELNRRLLQGALQRVMEPPPPPVAPAAPSLPDEDRLLLMLVKEGGILPGIMTKISALAGAPEAAAVKETLGERALNAAMTLAETNPAIVERVSDTLERIVNRLLPPPEPRPGPQPQPQPAGYVGGRVERLTPQGRELQSYDIASPYPAPAPAPQGYSTNPGGGIPETPQPDDNDLDGDDQDDEIMTILEDLMALLTSDRPLTENDPVFVQLQQEYPARFRLAVMAIGSQTQDELIGWIASKSPLYGEMFKSPVHGPHYRRRLTELQRLCRPVPPPQDLTHAETHNPEPEKKTPGAA